MDSTGVYVYAVTRAGHPPPAAGLGLGGSAAAVRLLTQAGLTAVVGTAPAHLRARRRDLMAHQTLLEDLSLHGPVLPMRFGVVSPDDNTVLAGAVARRDEYLAALERIDGQVEMNLKAMPSEGSLADLVREDKQVRRLREEVRRRPGYEASVRLGEAVAPGLRRRARQLADHVADALGELATEVRQGPDVEGCALNVSYLVRNKDLDRFSGTVEEWAAAQPGRAVLRLTGPLPCYSFVPSDAAPAGV
ncbi:GvpL/GvpF family gas vesicle protein [Streptomyces sp. NBC_00873]|uniref:GvpL/GvpF family gas vesicle protein n=1 Tax=unclassified Streptomyces TaxID=2593676 RepID=UPI00386EFE40|nr:GvpL/GvpF family gas vesicle protein [Streptomyces sp. NBC_00873]WTA48300.1 GvpL/GvpF family gas vesicle protein [Streptomyces sp. NBC_00842]